MSDEELPSEAASLSEDDDTADFASAFTATLDFLTHTGDRGQIHPPTPSQSSTHPTPELQHDDSVFAAVDQPYLDYVQLVDQFKNDEEIAACLQAAVDMDAYTPDSHSLSSSSNPHDGADAPDPNRSGVRSDPAWDPMSTENTCGVDGTTCTFTTTETAALSQEEKDVLTHRRLAHLSKDVIGPTAKRTRGFEFFAKNKKFCAACAEANSSYSKRLKPRTRATKLLSLIHIDMWGPAQVPGKRDGAKMVMTIVDDASRLVACYRLKRKSDAVEALKLFVKEYAVPKGLRIERIQTDGAMEFLGARSAFGEYCTHNGIRCQHSPPHDQQSNSVVERMQGSLFSMVRRMIGDAKLPAKFWDYALDTAVWLKQRTSTRALKDGITPHEVFWGEVPDLGHVKVFGSPAYVHVPAANRQKLDARAIPMLFVGYAPRFKAWRFLDLSTGKEHVSFQAKFNERVGVTTPALELLDQQQPADLQLDCLPVLHQPADVEEIVTVAPTRSAPTSAPTTRSAASLEARVDPAAQDVSTHVPDPDRDRVPIPTVHSHADGSTCTPAPTVVADANATRARSAATSAPAPKSNQPALRPRALVLDGAPSASSTATGANGTKKDEQRFSKLHRRMKLPAIAEHFGVDLFHYSHFIRAFSPFGAGERWEQPIVRTGTTRKLGFIAKGTEVPVPSGSGWDSTVADVADTAVETMLMNEIAALGIAQVEHMHLRGFGATELTVDGKRHTYSTPNTPAQILKLPDDELLLWLDSMRRELDELIDLKCWDVVDVPKGHGHTVGCKWVFKIKELADGTVERFKSRLTAKGFTQTKHLNYDLIFSPVVRFATVRFLIALAAKYDLELDQMDVGNAFVTSDLDTDDLYMEIPPWFEYLTSSPPPVSQDPRPGIGEPASAPMRELRRKLKIATSKAQIREGRFKGKALRLKKALYGLKQSSRCFNDKLSAYLATVDPAKPELGFTRSGTDYSIYYKRVPRAEPNERTGDGSPFADHDILIIASYVDDLILLCTSRPMLDAFKRRIAADFKMTDMGAMTWCLGMEIVRDRIAGIIRVSQKKYLREVLASHDMRPGMTRSCATPAEVKMRFTADSAPSTKGERRWSETNLKSYRQIVGQLIYAMIGTRPDIAWSVGQCARFFSGPAQCHMVAAKRILRFIASTFNRDLIYRRDHPLGGLLGFCDADWAGCKDSRQSTSGWILKLAGAAISWFSKKQPVIATSSAESEYIAMASCAQETMFFRQLAASLGIELSGPTTVFSDSQSALAMVANPTNARSKAIDIKYHYVRGCVKSMNIRFKFIPTLHQQADLLTKSLPSPAVTRFSDLIFGASFFSIEMSRSSTE